MAEYRRWGLPEVAWQWQGGCLYGIANSFCTQNIFYLYNIDSVANMPQYGPVGDFPVSGKIVGQLFHSNALS